MICYANNGEIFGVHFGDKDGFFGWLNARFFLYVVGLAFGGLFFYWQTWLRDYYNHLTFFELKKISTLFCALFRNV